MWNTIHASLSNFQHKSSVIAKNVVCHASQALLTNHARSSLLSTDLILNCSISTPNALLSFFASVAYNELVSRPDPYVNKQNYHTALAHNSSNGHKALGVDGHPILQDWRILWSDKLRKSSHDHKSWAIFVVGLGLTLGVIHSDLMAPAAHGTQQSATQR